MSFENVKYQEEIYMWCVSKWNAYNLYIMNYFGGYNCVFLPVINYKRDKREFNLL
jgi:hypothetical protein